MGHSTLKNQVKENSRPSTNTSDKGQERESELSEYEKIRQQNIIERERMFEELRIKDAKSENSVVKRPTPKKRTVLGPKEPTEPVRKSRRLAGALWVESDFEFAPRNFGTSRDLKFSLENERYMIGYQPSTGIFSVPDRPWPLASKK